MAKTEKQFNKNLMKEIKAKQREIKEQEAASQVPKVE